MINIIVLTKTSTEDLLSIHKKFLDSLLESRLSLYRIKLIVLENNSHKRYNIVWENYLKYTKDQVQNFVYSYNYLEDDFNMNRFYNIGLDYINPSFEYILFCNSDLIFQPGWLEDCIRIFNKKPNAGIVFPSSTIDTYQYRIATENGTKEHSAFRIGPERKEIIKEQGDSCPGWMFLFQKKTWDIIGFWDEDFSGWYQDWDMFQTIRSINKEIYYTRNSTVQHLEGMTFKYLKKVDKKLYEKLTDLENVYNKKWKKTTINNFITI